MLAETALRPLTLDWSLFGSNVRALRKSLGWSRDDLARQAGIGLTTIKRIEAGSHCARQTQEKLARALNTTAGSLWEKRLFDERAVSVFRPEDSRWRFGSAEDAAGWALNEHKLQIEPDAIQSSSERDRLGKHGLSEGFVRIFRKQFANGYLGCVFFECYKKQDIGLPPHIGAVCLYGARGTMIVTVDGESQPLREGDVMILDSNLKLELGPDGPLTGSQPAPICFGVLAQLNTGRTPRKRD